jgi:hypothetical protein
MSKWSSFSQGYLLGQRMVEDYGKAKKKREIEKIADAKPEELQGFTTDDANQLRAVAESGQYDIGIKTDDQGGFKGYTVTPKADPSQSGTVAMQGVTDFMGKRTPGRMTEDQIDRARQLAMAGVLTKYDPQEGMRMRREIRGQERDDERWNRQTKQWDRDDRKAEEEDAIQSGYKNLFSQTTYSQNQAKYQDEVKSYERQRSQYEADKAAGKPVGAAPIRPSAPEYSIGDRLADEAKLIDFKARNGRLSPQEFSAFTEKLNNVQSEGYEKSLRLAQSGAPAEEVIKAFNSTGQAKIDPQSIVSDKMVKNKDGVQTRVIQYRDPQGNVRTINALAELDALGKAGDVFTRHFQAKGDARADAQLQLARNADGRAGAQFAQGQADRTREREEADAARTAEYNLWKEQNPNATPAQDAAAKARILRPSTGAVDDKAPSDVKLAQAALAAGVPGVTDMASALQWARGRSEDTPRSTYLSLMKPQSGVPASMQERNAEKIMESVYGPGWREAVSGRKPEGPAKPKDESDAHAQARSALERGADKKAINERLRQMGFKPLP